MTINNPNIELVIAVLNGINVDGESMQYIIDKVGMRDQMKSQLGIEAPMPEAVLDQIAEDIAEELNDAGTDIIDSEEYGINGNEIYLEDIEYDKYRMEVIIKGALRNHFTVME